MYKNKYRHIYTSLTMAQTLADKNVSQLILTLPKEAGKCHTKISSMVSLHRRPSELIVVASASSWATRLSRSTW